MYGSSLDFSGVLLPGAAGFLNASNAMSVDRLKQLNDSGKKWRPDINGLMSNHNESILQANAARRQKSESTVNRDYTDHCDGASAMKEIFSRKKARMESFKEMKRVQYQFSEDESLDTEVLSTPLPAFKEDCGCDCSCASCRDRKRKDQEYREWSTEKRKELQSGAIQGSFAGPEQSFPISSAEDVSAAWSSVGRAKNPRQVMANIIKIAKAHGLESGLPDSVKQRLAAGESGLPS
jgi:hypothetical protein